MPTSILTSEPGALELPAARHADLQDAIFSSSIVTVILLSIAAVTMLMAAARLTISPWVADDLPYYLCGVTAFALHHGLRGSPSRAGKAIAACAEWYALFTVIALLGAIASYPLAGRTRGFSDAALEHVDRMLHFDWVAWYRVVAAHPVLQHAGRLAYQSIYISPAIILGVFAWEQRRREAQRFLATFWLAAVLTLWLFHFMPAVGPLASLWHGPIPYMPASALWQPILIPELRDHAVLSLDLGTMRGLVSAPSFHTEAAILYIAAAWPNRRLRAPLTLINLAMLLATPVEGTHYLADMLIGALVAGVVLPAIRGLERRLSRPARVERDGELAQARW